MIPVEKLVLIEDYISQAEEQYLLSKIPQESKNKKKGRNNIWRYGAVEPYKNFMSSMKIPDWLQGFDLDYDHVTVNEYYEGQFLNYHIDSIASGEVISIISLLGGGTLGFKNEDTLYEIEIPRRSLVQFSKDLRWKWKHGFTAREKRYSLVFRKSKKK